MRPGLLALIGRKRHDAVHALYPAAARGDVAEVQRLSRVVAVCDDLTGREGRQSAEEIEAAAWDLIQFNNEERAA